MAFHPCSYWFVQLCLIWGKVSCILVWLATPYVFKVGLELLTLLLSLPNAISKSIHHYAASMQGFEAYFVSSLQFHHFMKLEILCKIHSDISLKSCCKRSSGIEATAVLVTDKYPLLRWCLFKVSGLCQSDVIDNSGSLVLVTS